MRRSAFEWVVGAAFCVLLAVAHTWPLGAAPHRRSLNYNADAELNAWIVSWIAYALPHDRGHLFAGNIFQPDRRALAYSEPLFVPAIAGAPVRWLGGSAVLTFNLLLILGLAATAFAGCMVAYRWTGSWTAAGVGGALVAFNTHLLSRLPHLQAAHAWGLPLVLYGTDRLLSLDSTSPRRDAARRLAGLGVTIAAVAMTSEYWLFFAAVIIVAQVIAGARSLRAAGYVAIAGLLGVVLALPVLWPYLQLAAEGVRRPIEQAAQFSATPSGYLVSTSRVDGSWSRRFFSKDVDVLFPGVVALALAAVGAVAAARADAVTKRRAAALGLVAVTGFVLSLGPSTPVYRIAYRVVLPLQGLRVSARFGYLVLLAVALLAAYGTAWLERRTARRSLRVIVSVLAIAAVNLEAWHGPVMTTPFRGVPRIYRLLDAEPQPVLLMEAPFWPAQAMFGNAEYVLNATEHRAPIANGYSGFTPDAYRRRAQWFWFFPEPWAIATLRPEGITHVMVHLEQFGAEAPGVVAALLNQRDLELVAAEGDHRLYRLKSR